MATACQRDRIDPRREPGRIFQVIQMPVGPHKGFLRCVLCIVVILQGHPGGSEGERPVPVDQDRKGVLISLAGFFDEEGVAASG